tara:strand:+ start:2613 stop:2819 length:207 start_codon:yes stop_codon:yes gene_type:complete
MQNKDKTYILEPSMDRCRQIIRTIAVQGVDKIMSFVYWGFWRGGVAQLVRASACHAEGRGFESLHSRH